MNRVINFLMLIAILMIVATTADASCWPNTLMIRDLDNQEYSCGSPPLHFMDQELSITLTCPVRPDGISQLEFSMGDLPDEYSGGGYTLEWFADHVAGDPETGVVLSWDEPLADVINPGSWWPTYLIGRISFHFDDDPFWLPESYELHTDASNINFTDDRGLSHGAYGGWYTINCTSWPGDCCGQTWNADPPFRFKRIRYEDPLDGSFVAGAFELSFEVEFWDCYSGHGPLPFTGQVSALGETQLEFEGTGEGNYVADLDFNGLPEGSVVEVIIDVVADGFGGDFSRTLHYTIDSSVPVSPESMSAIKSRY